MSMYSTCGFICHFRLCIFNKSTETEKVKVRYHDDRAFILFINNIFFINDSLMLNICLIPNINNIIYFLYKYNV